MAVRLARVQLDTKRPAYRAFPVWDIHSESMAKGKSSVPWDYPMDVFTAQPGPS